MSESIKENLLKVKRQTISKDELESLAPHADTYESFAKEVLALEADHILEMVKTKGRSTRTPSLAHRYRINKHALKSTFHQQLQTYRIKFDNVISLDEYFTLDASQWQKDLPYIEKINEYIQQNGLPNEKVPAPERSFAIFGDEKCIEENGKRILTRVRLWEEMQIFPVSDPLMFAINPRQVNQANQFHLIVENKTTYQALLPALSDTVFSTLIYGQGNKVSKNIENFSDQYPVDATHHIFYFGDIDRSGIDIWDRLYKKNESRPALPFYEACLRKESVYGKTNQAVQADALQRFLSFFPLPSQETIRTLLDKGSYYPQEILKTQALQHIFIHTDWTPYVSV